MKKLVETFAAGLDRICDGLGMICAVLVVFMGFLITFEVFMRYVVGRPPLLADELSKYFLVAMTFLGISWVWKEKGHVRVEALVQRLAKSRANAVRIATLVLAFVFSLGIFTGSLDFIERSFSQNRTSDSWMHMPLKYPESTIVIGFLLLTLQVAVTIWRAVRTAKAGGALEQGAPK
jgi:TRAP-type C4-dicarboxylate transport system permease small subunit